MSEAQFVAQCDRVEGRVDSGDNDLMADPGVKHVHDTQDIDARMAQRAGVLIALKEWGMMWATSLRALCSSEGGSVLGFLVGYVNGSCYDAVLAIAAKASCAKSG